ncbi:MAG: hypothetical protein M0R76_12935 [Proteobacteria bacterium]|nr:hypothetical protein [Pseudomonadota bacterium]
MRSQPNQKAPQPAQKTAAILLLLGFLLMSAAVFFMLQFGWQMSQRAEASPCPAPLQADDACGAVAPPMADAVDAPQADAADAPQADAADAPQADATSPEPDTPGDAAGATASQDGVWHISFDPITNAPSDEMASQVAAIGAALREQPTAALSLLGNNHVRKSSRRALAAAQLVQERLRAIDADFVKRIRINTEQTAESDTLTVQATLHQGGHP